MQEKNGVAYCASAVAANGCPPRTVCAAPVFVPVTMSTDDLPLREMYDHPDFIDLISAQEFGLEQTVHKKLLLCIVAAATPDALHALIEMIVPAQPLTPRAVCEGYSSTLHICSDGARYDIPAEEQSGAFLAAMQDQQLPLPAVLAALTTWCTGYPATLFWESRP